MAGVPVYSTRGRGGGWRLVGGARTDLTGLQRGEALALLTMAAVAGQATPQFASAMRKVVGALPDPIRDDVEREMTAILTDSAAWGVVASRRGQGSSAATIILPSCSRPWSRAVGSS